MPLLRKTSIVLLDVCRPEGWPWAEAGLPEELQPSKQKQKGGRRKRSASPVSRDASHATAADSEAAQTDAETKTRPAKRAKRAAGVGAAKVSTRPPRRGMKSLKS